MLREFVDDSRRVNSSTSSDSHALTKLRGLIAYGILLATTATTDPAHAQEGARTPVVRTTETNESQQTYNSIEEWLRCSPESLRAKKALGNLTKLDDDEPSIREQAQKEIIESLLIVQKNILPMPQEFIRPLEDAYEKARAEKNAEVFLECRRILQTLHASEIDSPSRIPLGIEYKTETFPEILSKQFGLKIEGLNDELSSMIIRNLSNNRTPGAILGLLIRTGHFIEMDQNGGVIRIRRRVSSDHHQEVYDAGSICILTTLDEDDKYRETDCIRPYDRGPLLTLQEHREQPYSMTTFLHRVYDLVTQSKDYRKGKHSLALPRSKGYVTKVPGPDLPVTGAHVQQCHCIDDAINDPVEVGFVHARNPVQIPLNEGLIQTPLLSIRTERKNGTMTITMTPKVEPESEFACHSTICSLAGWSTFTMNGKELSGRMSMEQGNIVWQIHAPDDAVVNLHTHLGLGVSIAMIPSHP